MSDKKVGRPKSTNSRPLKLALYNQLYDQGKMTLQEICNELHISQNSFRNYRRRLLLEDRLREIGLDQVDIEKLNLDDIIW